MAEILKAILFGIVQGVTEWIPISSTGHMILLEEFLPLHVSQAFRDAFFVVIQFSSILAVVLLYFDRLFPFGREKSKRQKRDAWAIWCKIAVAAVPAGLIGILFDDMIDHYLYKSQVVALALVVYGVLFLVMEGKQRKPEVTKMEELSFRKAFLIGVFQVLALVPGTSRSGATILGAVYLGCSRTIASEFSFILAIPVMVGASMLKLLKTGFVYSPMEWTMLAVGCLSSFLVSMSAIKSLLAYVRKRDFKVFGYYRIVIGFIIILYFWASGHTLT